MIEIFWDLETQKFFDEMGDFDPSKLGVSIVCLCVRDEKGENMLSFWERDFEKMWEIFAKADRIVGFNSLHFDIPALKNYAPASFASLPHFDILAVTKDTLGRRHSLNAFAKATLGIQKIDSGTNAVAYWQSQDPENLKLLEKYCFEDVRITKDVYDFGFNNKLLKYVDHWNTVREVAVDFSYPVDTSLGKQGSLF